MPASDFDFFFFAPLLTNHRLFIFYDLFMGWLAWSSDTDARASCIVQKNGEWVSNWVKWMQRKLYIRMDEAYEGAHGAKKINKTWMRRLFLDDEELMLHDVKVNGKRERDRKRIFSSVIKNTRKRKPNKNTICQWCEFLFICLRRSAHIKINWKSKTDARINGNSSFYHSHTSRDITYFVEQFLFFF